MTDALKVPEYPGGGDFSGHHVLRIERILELPELFQLLLLLGYQCLKCLGGSFVLRLKLINLEQDAGDRLCVDLTPNRNRLRLRYEVLALIDDLLVALGLGVEAMLECDLLRLLMRSNLLLTSLHNVLRGRRWRPAATAARLCLASRQTATRTSLSIFFAAVWIRRGGRVCARRS